MFTGFEPVFDKDSKVLVLGSFPSVKSREIHFYYGNKQNRFWKTLESVFQESVGESIDDKKTFLLNHNIALWDIVSKAEIAGSSDSSLKCLEAADLERILHAAKIEKIICNGGKAYELFCKYYPALKNTAIRLPSTSPANVRFDKTKWQEALL